MGGKHKIANRTKNNARPSNSGRSAELLGTLPQFPGFSAVKDNTFGFPLSNTEELEACLDPNIQVILKKITKKDCTTKIKGLQELATFVIESDQETVKSILPVWPRFYNILATDIDNRVREATHNVHHQIVLKVKRNIAPYLKQLMAPWFTSQYDTYPPAASTAQQAFKDAFPPNKIQEAIIFCQEEILNYLSDNLLVQTAQTLSNLKHVTTEEAEAKYERVLISCLQGYYLYLEQVSTDQIMNATELNDRIISNSKFWKFSKSKVAYIKASFFKIISALFQKAPILLDNKGSHVTGSVIGSLEEHDPIVLPIIWEVLLLTISNVKNWWTFISIEKLFLPKLWKILKQGGQGNASLIYPSLLPLISHLPPIIDDNDHQFYNQFFENLWLGFKQKSTISSRSESVAVATSYIECFQFVILKKQSDLQFCKTLIRAQLISSIEWCIVEEQCNYKTFFNQISSLAEHWTRNSNSVVLKACLEFFLEGIQDVFRTTLFNFKENPCHNVGKVAEKQLDLLQSLKCTHKPKKQLKVKFSCETDGEMDTKHEHSITASKDKNYNDRLNSLVFNTCDDYVEYISEKKSQELIEHLYSLVIDFDKKSFFWKLNEKMKQKKSDSKLINIYTNILYKWLTEPEWCSKHVVSLIFLLYEYVENEDKTIILNTVIKETSEQCLCWCISEALAHPHNQDPFIKEWLKSDRVSKCIISITDKIIKNDCSPELSTLFKLALTENAQGELYIDNATISDIVLKFISVLENYSNYLVTADTCTSLAAYISAIIYTENLLLTYGDELLLALFKLSCTSDIDHEIISEETMYEVTTAWQDSVTLLTKNMEKEKNLDLILKLANIIKEEFMKSNLEETNINYMIKVFVNILRAIYRSLPLNLTEFLDIFVEKTFENCLEGTYTQHLCILAEYITGNLSSPYKEIHPIKNSVEKNGVSRYFAWIYLKIGILASDLEDGNEDDEHFNEELTANEKSTIILSVIDQPHDYIAQLLHDLTVEQTYLETFKNTFYFDTILHFHVLTEMKLKSTLENTDDLLITNLRSTLKTKSLKYGWHWAKAVYLLYSEMLPTDLVSIYKEFVQNVTETNETYIQHLTKLFSKHLTYDDIENKFDTIGNIITLRSLLHCQDIDVQIAEVFMQMEKIRSKNVPQFLYNFNNMNWQESQEIIEIIRVCAGMMKTQFESLGQRHWDFAILSLVSWASNCFKFRASYETHQYQAMLSAVIDLYVNTDNRIKLLEEKGIRSNYIDEWNDVLMENIHCDLLQTWLYLADQLRVKEDVVQYLPFIEEVSKLLPNVKCDIIFNLSGTTLPKWTKFLKQSCTLLITRQPNLQLWGYKMLLNLVPGLIKLDTEAVSTNTPHQNGLIFEQFKEKLNETHEIVKHMFMKFKLGEDSCKVESMTDSYTYTLAYLLLWDILLTLCHNANTELRFQYADWLRNENLLKLFLDNLFKLMPAEVLHYSEGKSKCLKDYFLQKPEDIEKDVCDSVKIEKLVCWLYSATLAQLPAVVRQWWTSLDSKLAQVVEKVTQMYVSPRLISRELNDVMAYQSKCKNMVVKVFPNSREIAAVYTIDEAEVELLIVLPTNYPLGALYVELRNQFGGSSHKQWMLQFKKCVVHQNGRIWDGLSLWNNNLDKKFDGVEECYICFAVLHPGTYQLPKLSCQTCRKKFHSACLYKWFRTSYKSSCPICRNLF